MFKVVRRSAVHGVCAAAVLALSPITATAQAEPDRSGAQAFPALPLPPPIEGLIGIPQTYTTARSSYLALITSEAEQRGLPAALADAVAQVESRYDPKAVGGLGEVGLMQIRPRTAALLGYKGEAIGLAEPETNVRLGVAYLARAWQLTNGDVCRALMKYRGGWGEERMTLLSAEYCRRARSHLAAIWTVPAGRSGQGAPNSICSAEPSPHRAGSPLDASGGHASSSPAISAKPLSLFGGRGRAPDSAQPEEPRWDTGTGIAPPSRAHRAHSDRSPRTAPGCCNGGRGGAQAD